MKILMLTPFPPYPLNSAARIRQWEQIQYLGRRHDLTVVSFAYSEEEYEGRRMLNGHCTRAVIVKHPNRFPPAELPEWQGLPWPIRYYCTRDMQGAIEGLQTVGFDLALVENLFMAQYNHWLPGCRVLQEYNIESALFKQYADLPEISHVEVYGTRGNRAFLNATWLHMVEYENRTWPKFPLRTTVSRIDKQEMDRRCPTGKTVVIDNGVNVHPPPLVRNEQSRKILFMGTMEYLPNTDAVSYLVTHILPEIWGKDPVISFCVAGRNPPPWIRQLASDPRIEVIANPTNMREVAQDCSLTVVPIRVGGGTRLKILDSMAMGLPVVSTSVGCEGLSVIDGSNILIRDDPAQFADAVLQVVGDPVLAKHLRTNGRRLVEERYDWHRIFERLETEMLSLVGAAKCG